MISRGSRFFAALGGVGYVTGRMAFDTSAAPPPLLLRLAAAVASVRLEIGRRVTTALGGERGAIANALLTGERGGISEATNSAYRDAGIFHILSISGLHMTVMAGSVFFIVRLLLAAVPLVAV